MTHPSSPMKFFLIFHEALRNQVDELLRLSMSDICSQRNADMIDRSLLDRYRLLGSIYKHNLNAKYEVLFSALDARVKSDSVQDFLLQHKSETDRFDKVLEILDSTTMENEIARQREFTSLAETLKQLVTQNMTKEEKQVFPLLAQHFSPKEQASLVCQYLCSIPLYLLSKLLPWLSTSLSIDEYRDLLECLGMIFAEDKLLHKAIFNMIERRDNTSLTRPMESVKGEIRPIVSHPIDDILLWHKAIKRELNEMFETIKMMHLSGNFTRRAAFEEMLKFISEICIFYSIAKDKVIFPAVYGENFSFLQRIEEESEFNAFRHLVETTEQKVSHSSPEFYSKLCSSSDQIIATINRHFYIEESQVLPLVREHFNMEKQCELLYQSLFMMPLRLIERVLPWLVGTMSDDEAKNFLHNIELAAPASDTGLILLFRSWACNADNRGFCESSSKSCCSHVKRSFHSHEKDFSQSSRSVSVLSHSRSVEKKPSKCSIIGQKPKIAHHSCLCLASEVNKSNLNASHICSVGCVEQPIDFIFEMHEAIRRDLEYLSLESGKLRDGDEAFLHQFIGRFFLLWGLYKAHSNYEDNIIYPALESREALRNGTHSYSLDHDQEETLFEEISCVLRALASLKSKDMEKDYSSEISSELSAKLQVMCNSIRVIVDQHIFREEHELWPLLRSQFSEEEQNKMVGFVLGTTGADVLQLLLPWVTSALTQEKQKKFVDILENVTKNTMFGDWLNECSKGNSVSMSQVHTSEACVSREGSFEVSMSKMDDKSKDHLDSFSDRAKRENPLRNYMASHWMASQPRLAQLGENMTGRSASFRDHEEKVFGCKHYKRNCKLVAACCGKLVTCRFCHDDMSDHPMDREATSEMMCMRCLKVQPIGPVCKTPSCNGFPMAKYYCNVCRLFDDERSVYHCPFCNVCRVGKGLGVDYFHCMSCNCCMSMRVLDHKCKEKCLETSCPVCDEFLFTSTKPVRALPCGHCIHSACFKECKPSPYECLICSQSSEEKMAKPESRVMVYNHIDKEQMETSSWSGDKSEKRVFGSARFWADRLYPFLLWLAKSFFSSGRVEKMVVGGNKTKDNVFVCCFVLCSLVAFCVMASLLVLLCLKLLRPDIYTLPL